MWSTLIVLAGFALAAALALRFIGRRARAAARGMRVLARLTLEPRRSLYLVEACGRAYLVGAGDGPLALLAELPLAEAHATTTPEAATITPQAMMPQAIATPASPTLEATPTRPGGRALWAEAWRRAVGGRA